MTDQAVYYKTAFKDLLAQGTVLKPHIEIESTGVEGVLIECTGTAPVGEQLHDPTGPWDPTGRHSGLTYAEVCEQFDDYFGSGSEDSFHIVPESDIVKRVKK